ncbi:hypothetical protein JCM10908_004930 [Rhodotorula pacifica]|uniref:uncharacterized protein n=1 Tax=Rhodotorula pacifica TaxID=1495444 RepID=UPI00317D1B8E
MSATEKLSGRRRPVKACTECVRSKTKCDRTFPCGACRKKGRAALCVTADDVGSATAAETLFDDDGAVVGGTDEVSLAARAELAALRETFAGLQPRIARMEALLNALERPERAGKRRRLSTDDTAARSDAGVERAAELQASLADISITRCLSSQFHRQQILVPPEREGPGYVGPGMYPFHGPDRDTAILPPSIPNLLAKYPSRAAFATITPSRLESQVLIDHCMLTFGALHPVINTEARRQHLVHFWVVESPLQLEHCYSSWLASYFAQAAVGARLASAEVLTALSTSHTTVHRRADELTEAAIASLYHANILHNRSLVALQAVAYLALSGRTAETFRAINDLVDHATVAAQHLHLERDISGLPAGAQGATEDLAVRTAGLEVRKRVVRALCIANWLYSDVPCITPDRVKGHGAPDGTLRDSTPTSYFNFLFDIARIVYRARFPVGSADHVSSCLSLLSNLGENSLPTEDPLLQSICKVHLAYWRLRLERLRPSVSAASLVVLAKSILQELPTLLTYEIRHWAVLHQVCAGALVLIGSWQTEPAGSANVGHELVDLAESFLLAASPANSIARKSLEAIRNARAGVQTAQQQHAGA